MDARSYTSVGSAQRYVAPPLFTSFVLANQTGIVAELKTNLDANRHTTVNERAAVNSMLVLNKIRTVSSC